MLLLEASSPDVAAAYHWSDGCDCQLATSSTCCVMRVSTFCYVSLAGVLMDVIDVGVARQHQLWLFYSVGCATPSGIILRLINMRHA
jgi:hypothetical protein